jgi:hypothetical protein
MIETAKGSFLQAPCNHSPQQVLAQSCRRRSSEHHLPAASKRIRRKRAISASIAAGSVVCRRMLTHSAHLLSPVLIQ